MIVLVLQIGWGADKGLHRRPLQQQIDIVIVPHEIDRHAAVSLLLAVFGGNGLQVDTRQIAQPSGRRR